MKERKRKKKEKRKKKKKKKKKEKEEKRKKKKKKKEKRKKKKACMSHILCAGFCFFAHARANQNSQALYHPPRSHSRKVK